MARSRNIKPGFFESEDLGRCEFGARLLFTALWTLADRAGRLEDRPMRIRAYAFPYDAVTPDDVERWLSQLQAGLMIERYESQGKKCIQVTNFLKHQNPHIKEVPTALPANTMPAPGQHQASTVLAPGPCSTDSALAPDKHHAFPHSSCEKTRLIPDSGFLIPDSLNPMPGASTVENPPPPKYPPLYSPVEEVVLRFRQLHPKPSNLNQVTVFFAEQFMVMGEDGERFIAWVQPIETSLQRWAKHWTKNGAQFAPKLTEWLRDEGWTKDPPAPPKPYSPFDALEE